MTIPVDDVRPEVLQDPDRIDRRKILAVTAAGIVIMTAALVVAWVLLGMWGQPPRRATPAVAPRTIGTLEQSLVATTRRAAELRSQQEASLHRWEWVDRDAGIARIPIEAAMDVMSERPLPPDRPLEPAAGAARQRREERKR
jgi:hypothetical protein